MSYYDVLGVTPTASPETINAAHKTLAKAYHPDINNSKDAHEKMTMLNTANEVLSDTIKRERYDNELRHNQYRNHNRVISASQTVREEYQGVRFTEERERKGEILRRKAEARLRAEEAAQKRRTEQAQQRAEEAAQKARQLKAEQERQRIIDESLAAISKNTKRKKTTEKKEDRYHATKVLLSMARRNNLHSRRPVEETKRKERINEILSLVIEINEKKNNGKEEWV